MEAHYSMEAMLSNLHNPTRGSSPRTNLLRSKKLLPKKEMAIPHLSRINFQGLGTGMLVRILYCSQSVAPYEILKTAVYSPIKDLLDLYLRSTNDLPDSIYPQWRLLHAVSADSLRKISTSISSLLDFVSCWLPRTLRRST